MSDLTQADRRAIREFAKVARDITQAVFDAAIAAFSHPDGSSDWRLYQAVEVAHDELPTWLGLVVDVAENGDGEGVDFPRHIGGGQYVLSDGSQRKGEAKALRAQARLV